MRKQLSLIIVTYNSNQLIFDCLDSIYKYNDIGDGLEIIIVDNCSKDQDQVFTRIMSNYPSDIILIKSLANNGYGDGNNQGVQVASAPRFIVMNPDVRLIGSIFLKIIAKFESDHMIGLMGVSFIDGSNSIYIKPEYCTLFTMFFERIYLRFCKFKIKEVFFSGSFLIFDKQIFIQAGSFDRNIFMFHEEADISNRILAIGKKTVFAQDIFVLHLAHGRTVNNYLLKVGAESRKYYFNKYNADLDKYYRRKLFLYRIKYIVSIILHNNLKTQEFLAWIHMCKNKGMI